MFMISNSIYSDKRSKQGSILIEAILAVVILSLFLTTVIRSFLVSITATVYSANYTKAIFLAESKIFDYIVYPFLDTSIQDEGNFHAPFENYKYDVTSDQITRDNIEAQMAWQEGEPIEVSEINMDISWPSGSNEQKISLLMYLLNE